MRDKRRDRAAERLAVAEVRDAVRASCIPPRRLAIRAYAIREGKGGRTRRAALDRPGDVDGARAEDLGGGVVLRRSTRSHSRTQGHRRVKKRGIRTVLVRVHWYVVDGCESERTAVHAPLTS